MRLGLKTIFGNVKFIASCKGFDEHFYLLQATLIFMQKVNRNKSKSLSLAE